MIQAYVFAHIGKDVSEFYLLKNRYLESSSVEVVRLMFDLKWNVKVSTVKNQSLVVCNNVS